MSNGPYISSRDAAAYLGLPSVAAIRMIVYRRQLVPAGRRGNRLLFTKKELDVFVAKGLSQKPAVPSPPHQGTMSETAPNPVKRHSEPMRRILALERQARLSKPRELEEDDPGAGARSVEKALLGIKKVFGRKRRR